MNSSTKLFACALVVAQLLGAGSVPTSRGLFRKTLCWAATIRLRAETGYTTYNSDSIANQSTSYELLVSNETLSYEWVRSFDGFREKNPVSVGTSVSNERVYVCRGRIDGGLFIGTLYLSQRACFIRYENWPMRQLSKYEVLVRKSAPAPWTTFELQVNGQN